VKKQLFFITCAAMVASFTIEAVILDNQFGNLAVNIKNDPGTFYCQILPNRKVDIGNNRILGLAVADGFDAVKGNQIKYFFDNLRSDTHKATIVPMEKIQLIADLLLKLPQMVIKIIRDPKDSSRPLVILPEKKELEEMVLKEHQAKAMPLIQEAGQLLPEKVNVPSGVADIAAGYVTLE
jgi:hypothetical protein